jgi:hypothetical protein
MHVDIMSKLYALSRGILHFVFAGGASWNDNIIKVHRAVPSLKGYHDLAGTKDLVRAHLTLMQHQQRVFNPACLSSSLRPVPAELRALGILLTVAAPTGRRCPFGARPVAARRAPAVGGVVAASYRWCAAALALANTVGPAQAQAQFDAVPNAAASASAAAEF